MSIALVTGSGGLVGSEAVRLFYNQGMTVVGIDNDMRRYFFGQAASTLNTVAQLIQDIPSYIHYHNDIRIPNSMSDIFNKFGKDITLILHAAAQPSHDWAAKDPKMDFGINAVATHDLLELARKHCPEAVLIFCSTNKIYGDRPNDLPFIEERTRWELLRKHPYYIGINEEMNIDQCKHSIFGASKLAADIIVQEYGRYFGMKTVTFRGGCLTGPAHAGAELHGFLSYLVKCVVTGKPYNIYGYKGKQVRDNIHSQDLVNAFWHFYLKPKCGEVYNIGGGRFSNCSILEAITKCQEITGKSLSYTVHKEPRIGDHKWYITNNNKFRGDYPYWEPAYDIDVILKELCQHYTNLL